MILMGLWLKVTVPSMVLCRTRYNRCSAFLGQCRQKSRHSDDGDEILTYLGMLAEKAKHSRGLMSLVLKSLMMHGQSIPYLVHLTHGFDRIDNFAGGLI